MCTELALVPCKFLKLLLIDKSYIEFAQWLGLRTMLTTLVGSKCCDLARRPAERPPEQPG